MNRKPLWLMCGLFCLAATSQAPTVAYTETIPNGVGTCATYTASFTAGQGTCSIVPTSYVVSAPSVLAFSTTGALMQGLRVTAVFVGGFSETTVWAATGANSGGAVDTTGPRQWSLTNAGDTFTTAFILTNSASSNANITDIIITGIGGVNANGQSTIFDRTSNPDVSGTGNEQTPGSHSGHDLSQSGTQPAYNILVTYSNLFRVTTPNTCGNSTQGNNNGERTTAPCGDEWATLTIHFNTGNGVTQFTPGSTFSFFQDADNTNTNLTVPEPATFGLFAAGLLGIAFVQRRRKNQLLASRVKCR